MKEGMAARLTNCKVVSFERNGEELNKCVKKQGRGCQIIKYVMGQTIVKSISEKNVRSCSMLRNSCLKTLRYSTLRESR